MTFDWNINFGNVATALILLVGFLHAHQQNIRKIQEIETKVATMFRWFEQNVVSKGHGR